MVYLGTLVGAAVNRLRLDIPNVQAIAIASGVAAAIATAFNAPIAGLVFAHEVILRHYSIRTFAATTVASAAGYVVANAVFDAVGVRVDQVPVTPDLVVRALRAKAAGKEPRVGPTAFPDIPWPDATRVPPPWEGGDGKALK